MSLGRIIPGLVLGSLSKSVAYGFCALDPLVGGGGGVGFLNLGVWTPVFFFLRLNIFFYLLKRAMLVATLGYIHTCKVQRVICSDAVSTTTRTHIKRALGAGFWHSYINFKFKHFGSPLYRH
jgi:hypothetical protein